MRCNILKGCDNYFSDHIFHFNHKNIEISQKIGINNKYIQICMEKTYENKKKIQQNANNILHRLSIQYCIKT